MTFLVVSTNKDVLLLPTLDIQTDPTSSADDGLPLKYVRRNWITTFYEWKSRFNFPFTVYNCLFLNHFFLKNRIVLLGIYVNLLFVIAYRSVTIWQFPKNYDQEKLLTIYIFYKYTWWNFERAIIALYELDR